MDIAMGLILCEAILFFRKNVYCFKRHILEKLKGLTTQTTPIKLIK